MIDYLETDLSLYDGSMGLMLSAADSLREIDNVKIGDDSDINAPYDHQTFGNGIQKLVQDKLTEEGKDGESHGMRIESFRVLMSLGRTISKVETSVDG